MWSGGISNRNPVRPAGGGNTGLTCQTEKTPACHITNCYRAFFIIHFLQSQEFLSIHISLQEDMAILNSMAYISQILF